MRNEKEKKHSKIPYYTNSIVWWQIFIIKYAFWTGNKSIINSFSTKMIELIFPLKNHFQPMQITPRERKNTKNYPKIGSTLFGQSLLVFLADPFEFRIRKTEAKLLLIDNNEPTGGM